VTGARVAVVGGRITGLAAAYQLSRGRNAPRVVVLEAGDRLGGKITTTSFAGVPVDCGPDAVLARVPWAEQLMGELGLGAEVVSPATGGASVYARGKLRPLPDGLVRGVPSHVLPLLRSGILSPTGIARAGLDLVAPRRDHGADPSIAQVIGGRLGLEVLDRLVDPLLSGINAGRADSLSLRATAPDIEAIASTSRSLLLGLRGRHRTAPQPAPHGPLFISLRDGLGLVDRLVEELEAAGVELRTSTPVTALGRDGRRWHLDPLDGPVDGVVLAAPAFFTAPLLSEVSPVASLELAAVEYSSVAVATLAYRETALPHPLNGSGFIVPRSQRWLMTAGTFVSTKWPTRHPPGQVILRCSAGRHGDDRPAALPDDDLVDHLHRELEQALGITEAPLQWRVNRWDRSVPQYGAGHLARADRIDATLAVDAPSMVVTGAAMRGVGVAACIRQGRDAGRRVWPGG
jgi:oxygen-dependent protoporphyrinogen oxidase